MRCASAHASSARLRVDLRERADQLERRGEPADLLDGAVDEREAEAILDERAPQPPPVRGAHEAIRGLDRGRLGHRHADREVRGEHHVEREVGVTGPDVDDEVVDGERAQAREPAALATGAELERRLDRVVRAGQDREAGNARRHEATSASSSGPPSSGGGCVSAGEPELRVHVRAGRDRSRRARRSCRAARSRRRGSAR